MDFTVVIPYWNGQASIHKLLNSLPPDLPVIIVDDHSDEPLQPHTLPRTARVIRPKTKGYFTGAVNVGIANCDTDVLVLNQDVWFEGNGWLNRLEEQRHQYAMMGERIQGDHPAWRAGYIHGTFMYLRRDAVRGCGLLDAKHYPLWGSTADYQCRLARKGFKARNWENVPDFRHNRQNTPYGEAITEMLRRKPELKARFIQTPPTISVIITCFNYGRYLTDAVNSLIGGETWLGTMPGQTFQGFEIIIVDDGSTDNTREIGLHLAQAEQGIRYLHQSNRGSASAMNAGIKASYGKYIAPLDGDDMMHPERLEKMLHTAESNPHRVIYDDVEIVNHAKERKRWKMREYDFEQLFQQNVMHKGLLYPKAAWNEVKGYPEKMDKGREDWAFNIALGERGWCGVRLDYMGYIYRRAGQNRTMYNTTPEWREHFIRQLMGLFPHLYQGARPMACCGGASPQNGNGFAGGQQQAALIPGANGMILMEYTGLNAGDSSWWAESGNRYEFGGTKRLGYVAQEDVNYFLSRWEGGRQLFRVAPVEKPQEAPVQSIEDLLAEDEPGTAIVEEAKPKRSGKKKSDA